MVCRVKSSFIYLHPDSTNQYTLFQNGGGSALLQDSDEKNSSRDHLKNNCATFPHTPAEQIVLWKRGIFRPSEVNIIFSTTPLTKGREQ